MPALTMTRNPAHAYRRDDVLTASPLRLVILVLGGSIASLERCHRFLAEGNGNLYRRELNRARGLISELFGALDKEQGGEIAEQLESLYEYILSQLLGAPVQPRSEELKAAIELLTAIKSGFDTILESGCEHA